MDANHDSVCARAVRCARAAIAPTHVEHEDHVDHGARAAQRTRSRFIFFSKNCCYFVFSRRYRVTALLDARAHRIKHRSRATVRARSSMEKSAHCSILCFSIIFRPAAVPDPVRSTSSPDRRDAARAADRLYILSRVDGGLYDASSRPHAHVRCGGRCRHSLAPGHAHSGSPRRHGSQHTSAAIPSWPALNRQRRPDSKCE